MKKSILRVEVPASDLSEAISMLVREVSRIVSEDLVEVLRFEEIAGGFIAVLVGATEVLGLLALALETRSI